MIFVWRPARSSDSRIILLAAPSHPERGAVAHLRLSSPITAARPCRSLTGFPAPLSRRGGARRTPRARLKQGLTSRAAAPAVKCDLVCEGARRRCRCRGERDRAEKRGPLSRAGRTAAGSPWRTTSAAAETVSPRDKLAPQVSDFGYCDKSHRICPDLVGERTCENTPSGGGCWAMAFAPGFVPPFGDGGGSRTLRGASFLAPMPSCRGKPGARGNVRGSCGAVAADRLARDPVQACGRLLQSSQIGVTLRPRSGGAV